MSRLKILFLFTALLVFGTHSAFATDYAVGTCEPKLTSYSSISDAVSLVPAGSIVEVCPGTYAEQFTISKALTLEGITSGNSNLVVITIPSGGLSVNASPFAAQVLVTAGPVNITNITVDGTGNGLGGSADLAGIYYGAGSSGVIKDVTTRYQLDSGHGFGIFADNTNSTTELLTIEDCSVHDFDYAGISVRGNYTATIKANHVNGSTVTTAVFGIADVSAGSITDNIVIGPGASVNSQGITIQTPSATVTGNTVTNWFYGFVDFAAASYTSNTLRDTAYGVYLEVAGAKVESNTITQSVERGIELNCFAGTVKSNTINDAPIGLDNVPSGLSTTNTYFNVSSFRTTCAGASAALPKGMAPPRRPTSE
jgi:hypothetical protein